MSHAKKEKKVSSNKKKERKNDVLCSPQLHVARTGRPTDTPKHEAKAPSGPLARKSTERGEMCACVSFSRSSAMLGLLSTLIWGSVFPFRFPIGQPKVPPLRPSHMHPHHLKGSPYSPGRCALCGRFNSNSGGVSVMFPFKDKILYFSE